MKRDAEEKDLLESVERDNGSPPAVAGRNERATLATPRGRSGRIGD